MSVTCENIGISGCSSFHFGKMLQVDGEFVQYPFWWQVTGSDLLIHEYTGRTYSVEGGAVYLPVLEGCKCGGNGDPSDCLIDFSITEELSNTPKGDWLGTSGFALSTICKLLAVLPNTPLLKHDLNAKLKSLAEYVVSLNIPLCIILSLLYNV